jgi:hypothetical protein
MPTNAQHIHQHSNHHHGQWNSSNGITTSEHSGQDHRVIANVHKEPQQQLSHSHLTYRHPHLHHHHHHHHRRRRLCQPSESQEQLLDLMPRQRYNWSFTRMADLEPMIARVHATKERAEKTVTMAQAMRDNIRMSHEGRCGQDQLHERGIYVSNSIFMCSFIISFVPSLSRFHHGNVTIQNIRTHTFNFYGYLWVQDRNRVLCRSIYTYIDISCTSYIIYSDRRRSGRCDKWPYSRCKDGASDSYSSHETKQEREKPV